LNEIEATETELLLERIDELNTACNVLREVIDTERHTARITIDALNNQIKQLHQMIDRLQLHVSQGIEL
jgi:DNA-directed RNA polymerase subunit L